MYRYVFQIFQRIRVAGDGVPCRFGAFEIDIPEV